MGTATVPIAKTYKGVQFGLPLANPETLFTGSSWAEAFEYVADYLSCRKRRTPTSKDSVALSVRELYFMKFYDKPRNYEVARQAFSRFSKATYRVHENRNRADEPHVNFTLGGTKVGMYVFRGATCFALGESVHSDGWQIKRGHFKQDPAVWSMPIAEFLKLVDTIERMLLGQGVPQECRVFMEAKVSHATIVVSCYYERPIKESLASSLEMPKQEVAEIRRFLSPQFSITFDC